MTRQAISLRRASSVLVVLVSLLWFTAPAFAQGTGSITGRVTDEASKNYLVGAEVRLAGTSQTVSTDRTGTFELRNVAAGAHSIEVSYLGNVGKTVAVEVADGQRAQADVALASEVLHLDTFTVVSVREGQSRAINQQRASNTISNIISADAIGNLPDNTIAEALARLPGVNVVVEGGAAAFASIRGSEAKLNSVTLDGERLTAAPSSGLETNTSGDTRAVDLSLIPSEMVGGIEVIKALAPDKEADSFGGTINLVTRSAYDLPHRSINGKLEFLHNDFGNKDGYAAALSYSDVLNAARTFGASATVSYRQQDLILDDYEQLYYLKTDAAVSGIAGVTDEALAEYDIRSRTQKRESSGGTLNLDWKVSDRTEWHLRTLFNKSTTEFTRFRTRERGFLRFNANSTDQLARGAEVRIERRLEDVEREQNVLRIGFQGTTRLSAGTLDYDVTLGDSSFTGQGARHIFAFASSTVRRSYDWTVDRTDPVFPRVTITHRATGENGLLRPQDMTLTQVRFQTAKDKDADWTAGSNYSFTQELGSRSIDWKTGVKYRTKDRTSRPVLRDFSPTGAALTETSFGVQTGPVNRIDGTVPTLGNFASLSEVLAFFNANPARFTAVGGDEITRLTTKVYDAKEDITAGYVMGTTKFGKLETIAGVRYEGTKVDYTWLSAPGGPRPGSTDYGNLFPSVIFNYRFTKNLVLRLAWTNTVARPDYAELVPYETQVDPQDSGADQPPNLIPLFRGNSSLKAQKSSNYDLSFEWYYQPTGLLSVAVFKKDVSDFVFSSQTLETIGAQNFIVNQFRNGASQNLTGVELSWQQSFAKLPAPFDGFGLNANATFVDGDSTFLVRDPATGLQVPSTENFLPNQAKRVYNVQLYWEKYGITARVAVNYTGDFVRDAGSGLVANVVNYPGSRWDAALSYRLTNNFTIYVEGKNLSEEVKSWYAGKPSKPEEWEFNGWSAVAGVKWRF
ncbi:MAG: TonB-dependent receptor [Opitutae bacterium]|nr:TonB-dependent receptor [Opitutae bacterium]